MSNIIDMTARRTQQIAEKLEQERIAALARKLTEKRKPK